MLHYGPAAPHKSSGQPYQSPTPTASGYIPLNSTHTPSGDLDGVPTYHQGQLSVRSPALSSKEFSLVTLTISQTWTLGTTTWFETYKRGMTATADDPRTTASESPLRGLEKATSIREKQPNTSYTRTYGADPTPCGNLEETEDEEREVNHPAELTPYPQALV